MYHRKLHRLVLHVLNGTMPSWSRIYRKTRPGSKSFALKSLQSSNRYTLHPLASATMSTNATEASNQSVSGTTNASCNIVKPLRKTDANLGQGIELEEKVQYETLSYQQYLKTIATGGVCKFCNYRSLNSETMSTTNVIEHYKSEHSS